MDKFEKTVPDTSTQIGEVDTPASSESDPTELNDVALDIISGGARKAGEGQKEFLRVSTTAQDSSTKPAV